MKKDDRHYTEKYWLVPLVISIAALLVTTVREFLR